MTERPSLLHNCPSCGAENQGFAYRHGYVHPGREQVRTWKGRSQKIPIIDLLIFSCGRCYSPVFVEVGRTVSDFTGDRPLPLCENYDGDHWHVLSIKPAQQRTDAAPEFTPPNVAAMYEQACRALTKGDADVAGMGFRKSLDVGTRYLIRELAPNDLSSVLKKDLRSRINWLHTQQRLTDELKDWAHIIREDGNEAAHEEDPYSLKEAEELHDFAKVFLMYIFTIPGLIKAKRAEPT